MNETLDRQLAERFALQRDALPGPDLADVRRRAQRLRAAPAAPPRRRRPVRRFSARGSLVGMAAAVVIAGGTATAFAVRALAPSPITQDFAALNDPTRPQVSSATRGVQPQVDQFFREQIGVDYTARRVGQGMFLARRGDDLCEAVASGAAGCTDHLDGDVWLFGDEMRARDVETAPFNVHLYGFARDGVAAIRVTTSGGGTITLPVAHNAFQTMLSNTTFSDITAIEVISSGSTRSIDPRRYFPAAPPDVLSGRAARRRSHGGAAR
jgi:hypothetical protein